MRWRVIGVIVGFVVLVSASVWVAAQSGESGLQGAWTVQELSYANPPTYNPINNPIGLMLFNGRHYSMIRLRNSDRPDFGRYAAGTATADQLRAIWGPLQAHAGTFEVAGSTLTVLPTVAKNPRLMDPDSSFEYSFTLAGDTLTLATVRINNEAGNLSTMRLTRVQ
jgi:hypothetical protein